MSANRMPQTSEDPTLELLARWLSLSEEGRKNEFGDTDRAARIAGVARRTLQDWIEKGWVASSRIGKKYQVSLDSLRLYLEMRASSSTSGAEDRNRESPQRRI